MTEDSLQDKFVRMGEIIRPMERVAVAFSAGVDSTLVLKAALDVLGPDRVVAVTGKSDSLARAELAEAVKLTEAFGAEHVVLETDELSNELIDRVLVQFLRCTELLLSTFTE